MDLNRLFGSRVRAEVLLALASTRVPQSAYRLARAAGAEPIHVLRVLRSLGESVERRPDGWVLRDAPLRRFLRSDVERRDRLWREEKDELLVRLGLQGATAAGRREV